MRKRTTNDPLIRAFLDRYGLNLLAVPREGAKVGDLYVEDRNGVSAPGSVVSFVDPPLVLPRQKRNEVMADVAGLVSDEVDIKTGLGLLEGFLVAVGAGAIVDKVRAEYEAARARTMRFRFPDATRDSVDPIELGTRLEEHKLAEDHPLWAPANRYYLVTAVARTSSISVRAAAGGSDSLDLEIGALTVATGSAQLSVHKSESAEVTYRGNRRLAFGVELLELVYDQERHALALRIPADPIRVRGEGASEPHRAFIGGRRADVFVTINEPATGSRPPRAKHALAGFRVSALENESPGSEIELDLTEPSELAGDAFNLIVKRGDVREVYDSVTVRSGKNNVITAAKRSRLVELEDIGGDLGPVSANVGEEIAGPAAVRAAEKGAAAAPESGSAIDRFLHGRFPLRVRLGDRVSLQVRISTQAGDSFSAPLRRVAVPEKGLEVLLVVHSPGFTPRSETQRLLNLPPTSDSDWTVFELEAAEAGVQNIEVTAFNGGSYLGILPIQTTVDPSATTAPSQDRTAHLSGRQTGPGDVTLLIHFDADQNVYRYQWLDGTTGIPEEVRSNRLIDTPQQAIEALVAELNTLARGRIPYTTALTNAWLQGKGIELWQNFIPADLQTTFWQRRDSISRLMILSSGDVMPWELLYPYNEGHDAGFLVDQFPIARWLFGRPPVSGLRMSRADFVVPTGSPAAASEEVSRIKSLLPASVSAGPAIESLEALLKVLSDETFSVLHFACHNAFRAGSNMISEVLMGKQPFQPTFLTNKQNKFSAFAPLVFMNACRTDGQAPLYTKLSGWALRFLGAGASAFVGSLWEVRDGAASDFSQTFYKELLAGRTLGDAMRQARQAIRDRPGDPTWLAYTLYGDPAAAVRA